MNVTMRSTKDAQQLDLQFQHHFLIGNRQDFIWGVEDRYSISKAQGNFFVSLVPAHTDSNLFSAFAQDEIMVLRDRVYLTVGDENRAQLLHRHGCYADGSCGMDTQSHPNFVGRLFPRSTNS